MLEYNFSNANFENDEVLGYTEDIIADQEIKFDSSSLVLGKIKTKGNLTANYSLICMQSLEADEVIIRNDLICFKDIVCNTLEIAGDFKCFGNIKVGEMLIGGTSIINSAYIVTGEVEGDLIGLENIEIEKVLDAENVVCMEGMIGNGKLSCNNIYVKDYITIELESNPDNVDISINKVEDTACEVERKSIGYEEIIEERKKYITEKQEQLIGKEDIGEILECLDELRKLDNSFDSDYEVCQFIQTIEHINIIEELNTYLMLIHYKHTLREYLYKVKPIQYVFGAFLNNQRSNLHNMKTSDICSHKKFIKSLDLYEQNKDFFYKSEQEIVVLKLYQIIGIKSKLVDIKFKI